MSAASPTTTRPGYAAGYAARDVAHLLGFTVPQILAHVRAGSITPRRGPRREYRFSFQDLVLLRAARELMATLPSRRIHRALRKLRQQLPSGRQLATVRITAEGDEIVVREGSVAWIPESGQALLDLDVAALATEVAPLAREAAEAARQAESELSAEDWYRLGCDLEPCDPRQAQDAYRRALRLEPGQVDALLNLGRLLHEAGEVAEAANHYRHALEGRPDDATAAFNLGVALEDLGRPRDAVAAYERALACDPAYADAHFNLSRLHERLGESQRALRHLQAYRGLAAPRRGAERG